MLIIRRGNNMDLKTLAEQVDLEVEEYREMIELFLQTVTLQLHHLKAALETGDSQKVAETAHSIKGSSASLGLTQISGMARGMELKARENNLNEAALAFQTIKAEIHQIAQWVSDLR
ncbi:MAG: Hpt domain-containing protein [Desulfobacterota bacterium]|nr:Hpt domain-containing protein [Thermodesulfobacteriota bacterium]